MSAEKLEKIERKLLQEWANAAQNKAAKARPIVRMPHFPRAMFGTPILGQDGIEEWQNAFRQRQIQAILELAEDSQADPLELAKVANLILDIRPPETRGQKPVSDIFAVFLRAAAAISAGKPKKVAAELAGVSERTLRDYIEKYPREWQFLLDFADLHCEATGKAVDPLKYLTGDEK